MAGNQKADAILARFPGPVTMPANRRKAGAVLAGSLAFCTFAVYLLVAGNGDAADDIRAWTGLIFFALCAVVAAVMLLPGAGSLTLAADGFTMCSLFRTAHAPWRQAGDFTVASSGDKGMTFVGYEDARLTGFAAEASRSLIGRNASLPDTYGLSHEELAPLLTRWQALALEQGRAPGLTPRR
jgi:hypothetical protein